MCGIRGVILVLCALSLLTAQVRTGVSAPPRTIVSVPFVGCDSDGQGGPLERPEGTRQNVAVDTKAASRLAFYKAEAGLGVLAPRGWYCFGVYGSGGAGIYVSPRPIDRSVVFSQNWPDARGPIIRLERHDGETSGRFGVAEIVARVFPAHKAFVDGVRTLFEQPEARYPSGPYPADKLRYKSNEVVEYQTPAKTEGMGTGFPLKPAELPVRGVAIFVEQDPSAGGPNAILIICPASRRSGGTVVEYRSPG